jgi:hypothetical protein
MTDNTYWYPEGVIECECRKTLLEENERLRNENASRIHSCHDQCVRLECAQQREIERLRKALEWYGEQAHLARLIHREGDAGRNALASDGGHRAREALEGK